ncbi:GATA transcription factor 2-like [Carica papaya]|uniref:GATA transcription factor 2-like n=1 Tax=Carica papaya TaxID=3649 RepID=UPI000B8C94FA|nr:GATA transcription factor 2-like [Carica papaya]
MDMYGLSSPDLFRIDDLLDFSNDDLFSVSSTAGANSSLETITTTTSNSLPPQNPTAPFITFPSLSTDSAYDLCVPTDDVAELEWLSRFVDDSFSDFPSNSVVGSDTSLFPGRARSKRSRATSWTLSPEAKGNKERSHRQSSPEGGVRRCTHCASEKTPQWRTGPLGPKTLCNACGVRYKSGRLVPEYRPAASPTFVLTQHSNSHRKVLELRRQKEVLRQQEQKHQVC